MRVTVDVTKHMMPTRCDLVAETMPWPWISIAGCLPPC
jgi:hypothetical protein